MSKESAAAGLHRRFHGGVEAKREKPEAIVRGTFRFDSLDYRRVLEHLHGRPRT